MGVAGRAAAGSASSLTIVQREFRASIRSYIDAKDLLYRSV
jgi:hypothetical protein